MNPSPGIWFVYRSHYEGPLSRRVRRLDAPSILAWFRSKIDDARTSAAPGAVADTELGGPVYGLESFFLAVKEHTLHTPKTNIALGKMLREHLYVEGGDENIKLDAHSLRVFTDDDEVELAYYFFDDEAVATNPLLAFLLTTDPALPDGDADGGFEPTATVPPALPPGKGEGATYAALFTFYDSESLPGRVATFPGVRLPGLAAHLRNVVPTSTWPVELRLLRAMVEPDDTNLGPALTRVSAYPLSGVGGDGEAKSVGTGQQSTARAEFVAAAKGMKHLGDPTQSIVHSADHVAVLCAHTSKDVGFQQWVLFDDRWAGAHADLAKSIVHAAQNSDPFVTPKAVKKPKSPAKAKADGEAPAPKKAPKGGTKIERAWKAAVGQRTEGKEYRPSDLFKDGELVTHVKFGLGVVTRVDGSKIEVLFRDTPRVMIQGMAAPSA
jgi:hypothetical protein